ncbi:hypothetical protein BTHE68_39970 [Burkholderia sp. THE68]|uniref:hypothetical protein n=1 Tax=Burkholderia sp. THE68 TaxID=758782 RepID=UPI0013168CBD|nr:hypothetical protein [Burkholderia sp. THE68]BBU30263.1 hypothetical protein BTHE68_39970 [Burkholderia sp. THE68]
MQIVKGISVERAPSFHAPFEQAFLYVVELLQDMDASLQFGIVPAVPEVLIWMLEKQQPEMLDNLRTEARLSRFEKLLTLYHDVRIRAGLIQREQHWEAEAEMCCELEDWGHVELEHIAEAIQSTLQVGDPDTAAFFAQVVDSARHRRETSRQAEAELAGADAPENGIAKPSELVPWMVGDTVQVGMNTDSANAGDETDPVNLAEHYAKQLLVAGDNGRYPDYWTCAYAEAVVAWVEEDMPGVAAELVGQGRASDLLDSVGHFLESMRQVEHLWDVLSAPLRRHLSETRGSEADVSQMVEHVVRAESTGQSEADVIRRTALVVEMLSRRSAGASTSRSRLSVFETETMSRSDDSLGWMANGSTCRIVKTSSLPANIRAATNEAYCLLVDMESQSHLDAAELASTREGGGVDVHIVERSDGSRTSVIAINKKFWCEWNIFMEVMPRFRTNIPILYLMKSKSVLVVRPFCFFAENARVRNKDLRLIETYLLKHDAVGDYYQRNVLAETKKFRPLIFDKS